MSDVAVIQPSAMTEHQSPADNLLALAIQKGASIEQLTQLFDLKLKVEANDARKAFVRAMSAFRSEVQTIEKNGSAHNSKYATLDNITSQVNPLLAKNGLSFCWSTEQSDRITVHCDITHTDGHSQRTTLSAMPDTSGSKNAIQAIGSAVTYLQRYTLNAALGLATGVVDDDGRGAGDYPRITADQAAEIKGLLEYTGSDVKKFLDVYTAPTVDALHQVSYTPAITLLKGRKAKMDARKGEAS
jgi:hypothetical protein